MMASGERLRCELVVIGTPVSQQTRRRARLGPWIEMIAKAALASGAEPFGSLPVRASITYYFEQTDIDLDNMLKPIMDGLKRAVIDDDKLVVELWARKHRIASARLTPGWPSSVVAALISGQEFVYILVEPAIEGRT